MTNPDPRHLASDGDAVLLGTDPITDEERAEHAALTPEEVQAAIDTHIAEVDAWKANQR